MKKRENGSWSQVSIQGTGRWKFSACTWTCRLYLCQNQLTQQQQHIIDTLAGHFIRYTLFVQGYQATNRGCRRHAVTDTVQKTLVVTKLVIWLTVAFVQPPTSLFSLTFDSSDTNKASLFLGTTLCSRGCYLANVPVGQQQFDLPSQQQCTTCSKSL